MSGITIVSKMFIQITGDEYKSIIVDELLNMNIECSLRDFILKKYLTTHYFIITPQILRVRCEITGLINYFVLSYKDYRRLVNISRLIKDVEDYSNDMKRSIQNRRSNNAIMKTGDIK